MQDGADFHSRNERLVNDAGPVKMQPEESWNSQKPKTQELKMARKYSKASGRKVKRVMHEMKRGTLKSGSGQKIRSRKQAIAIGLSEARRAGNKVPKRRPSSR